MSRAIWKVKHDGADYWYATRAEARAFFEGVGADRAVIERVEIGSYMNPQQLVKFIRTNFGSPVIAGDNE